LFHHTWKWQCGGKTNGIFATLLSLVTKTVQLICVKSCTKKNHKS
jgi:hypothetical protein